MTTQLQPIPVHATSLVEPRSETEDAAPGSQPPGRRAHAQRSTPLFSMPPGLSRTWSWVLVGVVVLQLVVIAFTATYTAFRLPYFSPIDESAHYSYIQQVAEHGSLPVLGKTEASPQALAIEHRVYPRPFPDSKQSGLQRLSYEALQPPLYYAVAVPAFLIPSNYIDKIYAVRLFDVLLLLVTVVLAARLCRMVLKDRWMLGWSMLLVFLALPVVILRMVTISNLALTLPISLLFITELWTAWERHSGRRFTLAGLVLGLCVLTQLELVAFIPVFLLVVAVEGRRRWSTRTWHHLIVAVAVPLVVMAPWFLFNEAHYHMLTAGTIAISEQTPILNPYHIHYAIGQLPDRTVSLLNPGVPADWINSLHGHPALTYLDQLLGVLIIPAAVVLVLGTGRRVWSMQAAILGLPWVFFLAEMWYIQFGQQWTPDVRYTFAAVPILLILAADATDIIRSRYLPVLVTVGATASVLALWEFYLVSYSGPFAFL